MTPARRAPSAAAAAALLPAVALLAAAPAAGGQTYSEWVHHDRLDVASPWGQVPVLVTYPRRAAGPLLAAVREAHEGAARRRASTGIDGISLGGRLALEVGLRHPEAFAAVSGIQPAVSGLERDLAALAAAAQPRPGLRLMTSDDDPLRPPTLRLSAQLRRRRLPHRLTVVPGPHDYAFNRGPGCLELLLYHGAVLPMEPR